ncbi:hypothetical protein BJP40_17720 [Streptomyces sp. CC53]|uniref:DUF4190 domain-containing protein n=1 Tax=unclassified Streptomyces TaxID=2593676 RepID=UPI0008DD71BC|nr:MULTISPECIES: DUF4190 domain-containing protein [unclassified Streptomyces]OII65214.1 hypothetical protein BJP40_17720 [Streptomyces sp. CC53]
MSHSTHQSHHTAPAPAAARNGLGVAALVLGIIGALSGLVPLLFWLAGTLGLLALVFGLVGRGRAKKGQATNKGMATTGAVLGLVSLLLACFGVYFTFKAADEALQEIDKALQSAAPKATPGDQDAGTGAGTGADAAGGGDAAESGKALAAGATHTYADGLEITVSAPKPFEPSEYALDHTEGNQAYQVTVTVENGSKKDFVADGVLLEGRAGADGVDAPQIYDEGLDGLSGTVLPGKKATATYAFDAPADAKTLTVEVSVLDLEHDSRQWELKL